MTCPRKNDVDEFRMGDTNMSHAEIEDLVDHISQCAECRLQDKTLVATSDAEPLFGLVGPAKDSPTRGRWRVWIRRALFFIIMIPVMLLFCVLLWKLGLIN